MNRDIQDIISDYWNCAYQQGLERREHDDQKGTAQRLESELQAAVATLTAERLTVIGRIAELEGQVQSALTCAPDCQHVGPVRVALVAAKAEIKVADEESAGLHLKCIGYLSQIIAVQKEAEAANSRAERLEKAMEGARSTLSMGHTVREREAYSIILKALAAEKGEENGCEKERF